MTATTAMVILGLATYHHAKGFGAYVKATMERPHAVPGTYMEQGQRYCAQCSYPVVAVRVKS